LVSHFGFLNLSFHTASAKRRTHGPLRVLGMVTPEPSGNGKRRLIHDEFECFPKLLLVLRSIKMTITKMPSRNEES
jgi:hypothetical protein